MKQCSTFIIYSALTWALASLATGFGPSSAHAQYAPDPSQSAELIRTDFKSKKVELITDAMKLGEQEGKIFWPIYREYDVELSKLNDQRLELISAYAANYTTLTDEMADDLAGKWFKLHEARIALLKKYHHRIAKAVSPVRAVQFSHIERFIDSLIDVQVSGNIPFVEKIK